MKIKQVKDLRGDLDQLDSDITALDGFDFVDSGDPAVNTNPSALGATWINTTSGEIFVATDITIDQNIWVGTAGTTVSYTFQGTISGYVAGGRTSGGSDTNVIDKFSLQSDANATDVGDLTISKEQMSGQSSQDNGYCCGGTNLTSYQNVIEKFPFATDSNSSDVGDLIDLRGQASGQSSGNHGYNSGGRDGTGGIDVIEKFTFASDANATDVGDLLFVVRNIGGGQSSVDNGYTSGGNDDSSSVNTVQKFPFASDTNASDVGDLTVARQELCGQSSFDNGYTSGGTTGSPSDVVDKFPFASDTNASDVGNLTVTRRNLSGQSSTVSGYTSGGFINNVATNTQNVVDKFPFASDTNATDVGDLTVARLWCSGHQN